MHQAVKIGLAVLLCSWMAYGAPFTISATVNESGFTGNFPQDHNCAPFNSIPLANCNANLEAVQFTQGLWDFTSNPNYHSVFNVLSATVTLTLNNFDTTSTSSLFNNERLWFLTGNSVLTGVCGSGISLNGFASGSNTLMFSVPGNNTCLSFIASTVRSTGQLGGAIRDFSNSGPFVTMPGTAITTISITADSVPEPRTSVLLLAGLSFLCILRRRTT